MMRAQERERYIEHALISAADAVRNAANGHRNETLNHEAFSLAGFITMGGISEDVIRSTLGDAAVIAGLQKHEVDATLRSAIEKGKAAPREFPEIGAKTTKPRLANQSQKPASAIDEAQTSKHIADAIWRDGAPATAHHGYVAKKLGLADGLRTDKDGNLVAPLYTLDGELVAVQSIPVAGKKKFATGTRPGSFPDACFIVGGPLQDGETAYIVEGLGQGWTAHQATRQPAAVCFGVGRMAGVAQAIHKEYPAAKVVLVADVGKENQMAEIARAVGGAWVECPHDLGGNGDINDLHQRDGLQAVTALLEQAKECVNRFKLQTPEQLAQHEPIAWRIKRVIPKLGIGSVYGPSTGGKSFWILRMLAAVSRREQFFGYITHFCPCTYVASEGEWGVAQRVRAHEKEYGRLPDSFRVVTTQLDILNADDRLELVRAIRTSGQDQGIVVFDTLNRAAPGIDENDSSDMGNVVTALKWLQEQMGGIVLVVHHTGKDAGRGPRGHSSLFAALDFGIEITRDGDRRTWINRKTRDGEDGTEHAFRLKVVEVGTDEDGDPLTSCVIEEVEDPASTVRSMKLPAGGNQRIVWDAVGELLRQPVALIAKDAPADLPTGRPAIRLEDALTKLRGRLPEVEPKRQRERINDAITGLINRGALVLREGWIWCA